MKLSFYHIASSWLLFSVLLLSACDSGKPQIDREPVVHSVSQGQSSSANSPEEASNKTAAGQILLHGQVTFDQIPRSPHSGRLLFDDIYRAPVRGAQIEALGEDDSVIYSTVTSENGEYSVVVPAGTPLRIRVWARIEDTDRGQWQARVIDNTHHDATYAIRSKLIEAVETNTVINIHAASDWGNPAYKTQRASAPFAILDALYDGFTMLSQVEHTIFPELSVAWSPANIAVADDPGEGLIGSSYYTLKDGAPKIYLLGHVDNDADDYDRSVILHEFGHFVMDHISRSDSVGGGYSRGAALDLRVSFNEAISNVFAALIDQQPKYFDAYGNQQASVQVFDLELHDSQVNGWYSTEALSWLIYDIVDDVDDEGDSVSLGWKGLHEALTAPSTLEFPGAMSIYSFLQTALSLNPDSADAIHSLAERHAIFAEDAYGTGENDSAGSSVTLPIYRFLTPGTPLNVCSDSFLSDFNGADVHRLIQFEIVQKGVYSVTATRNGGPLANANPEFVVYHQGDVKLAGFSGAPNREQTSHLLDEGVYLLDVFERSNADHVPHNGGLACFDISILPGDEQNAPIYPVCDNLASLSGDSRCNFDNAGSHNSVSF